jgi:hypothetical protein
VGAGARPIELPRPDLAPLRDLPRGDEEAAAAVPPGGELPHAGVMAPVPTSPEPGNLTVPLLFGWGDLLVVLVLLLAGVVVFLVVTASAPAATRRSEWQAWLDGRSKAADAGPDDVPGER